MKIVFLTTQSNAQSTVLGRVVPLARQLQQQGHKVTLFLHRERNEQGDTIPGIPVRITGKNPFKRTKTGKMRRSGVSLIWTMKINAFRAAWGLLYERPDRIILVKPLPENTFAAFLAKLFLWNTKVILDVDDFELFANKLSSLGQRAAVHISEAVATRMATCIVVATPFLYDHMHQMVAGTKSVTCIPTGLDPIATKRVQGEHRMLYIGSISVSSGHRVDLLPAILSQVRKELPNASLVVAGTGDSEHLLQEKFKAHGLTNAVTFFGAFTNKDVPTLVSNTDVLIDPVDASIVSRAKSSFRTALALATGTAIVTSSVGIRTDLLPPVLHEMFFATPEDPPSYANRIIRCLQTPLSETDIAAMMQRAQEYTWKELSKTYLRLLV